MTDGGDSRPELPQVPGFELVRRIGKGGMGEVYEAVRVGTGGFRKPVALKTLTVNAPAGGNALERFLNECRISARLEHPNIVRVHDLVTVAGRHFLVMELLHGADAGALARAAGSPVPAWLPLSIAVQALEGLAYAHELKDPSGRPLGLIHRDLTPRNLFITETGTVKILDFGLARLQEGQPAFTQRGYVVGTPAYLSPEQVSDDPLDARTDVYQVAATMYSMLTGAAPHSGGSVTRQLEQARDGIHVPLRAHRSDLPDSLIELVEKALKKDPASRFPDARSMRDAVARELMSLYPSGPQTLAKLVHAVLEKRSAPPPPPEIADVPTLRSAKADVPPPYPPSPVPSGAFDATHVAERTTPYSTRPDEIVSSSLSLLPTDHLVGGRYRILRFLAQGGMGAVYEAEDEELRDTVALKTMRPELAADPKALERFKREIHLARLVTHPNVCRIFDLGFHPQGGAEGPKTVFLTMELLDGETLADKLRRTGRLTGEETVPIATQLCAGLAAAHAAGVVHGDLKTDNIFLVPGRTGDRGVRAVITDFGLARASAGNVSVTDSNFAGSPGYMSPEQVEGAPLTPAADVYSLGVVLFELLTGELPFRGENAIALALKRLRDPPTPPRQLAPDLDPIWEQVLLRCLERDPAKRFSNVEEIPRALGVEISSAVAQPRSATLRIRSPRRRALAVALAWIAALALAAGATFAWRARDRLLGRASSASATAARRTTAVLGFRNISAQPQAEWLATALSETFAAELAAGGKLRVLPNDTVTQMRADLKLAAGNELAPEPLARIRTYLGADLLLTGAYLVVPGGDKLRVDAQAVDARSGEIVASVTETGAQGDLLDIVARAGSALRERLGLTTLTASEASEVRSTLPTKGDAARLYSDGLAKLRRMDALGAQEALERALAEDPEHPLIHSALASTYYLLGYEKKAADSAERAASLSAGLSREERLSIEALEHELKAEHLEAAESARALFTLYPDNIEYGLVLARNLGFAGKYGEGYATLDQLRKLPQPASDDPRIDFVEANVAQVASDFARETAAAQRAALKAERRGIREFVARARLNEGWARQMTGDYTGALAAIEEAKRICESIGQRGCVGQALDELGTVRMNLGDYADARKDMEQGLAIRHDMGAKASERISLNNLAILLSNTGDVEGAMRLDQRSLEIAKELGDTAGIAGTLNNIGNLQLRRGDAEAAAKSYEETLRLAREANDKSGIVAGEVNLGEIYLSTGNLQMASTYLDEALKLFLELKIRDGEAYAHGRLWQLAWDQGDLAKAKQELEISQGLYKELGAKIELASFRAAAGAMALDQGAFVQAEADARSALPELTGSPDYEMDARAVLAMALLGQRKVDEAAKEVPRIEELFSKSEDAATKVLARRTLALVTAGQGKSKAAKAALSDLLGDPIVKSQPRLAYEVRLALAKVEAASGSAAAARKQFDDLARDAKARGYLRIAALAKASRAPVR